MSKYCPSCGSDNITQTKSLAQSGKKRWQCHSCPSRTTQPLSKPLVEMFKQKFTDLRKYKRFVITSAQNDTPLDMDFFNSLLNYCKVESAALLVIPVRYKNPDSFHEGAQNSYTWPDEIRPYLCDQEFKINDNLKVMGQIKITATAVNPLMGLDTISGHSSAIIGHGQLAMTHIATPKKRLPKKMHTTGSVSQKNYSQTKEGAKGEHHHSLSAVVVETEGNQFWVRQLMGDSTGGFYDLDRYYTNSNGMFSQAVEGMLPGDLHERFLSKKIREVTFTGTNSLMSLLRPKHLILNDILDQYADSPHHQTDALLKLEKHWKGSNDLRKELDSLCRFLESVGESYIIESNHHDHLRRGLNNFLNNKLTDVVNADLYLELGSMFSASKKRGEHKGILELYLDRYCKAKLHFVDVDDEFLVAGIDCSQHGDRGANGSRPSPRAFANAGAKMMVGHSHTPRIEKGFWQVGTSTMDLDYAKGLSSWMITHGVIYANGKRALIDVINGKYRPSWAMREQLERKAA